MPASPCEGQRLAAEGDPSRVSSANPRVISAALCVAEAHAINHARGDGHDVL